MLERQVCVRLLELEKGRNDSLRYQLALSDYLIESLQKDEDDLTTAVEACNKIQEETNQLLDLCDREKKKEAERADKEERRKKFYRTTTIILGGILVVGSLLTF